jgi:protein-tyrosine-phosphatase
MFFAVAIVASLASCGSSTDAPASYQGPPLIASKADVIVTLDRKNQTCIVALNNEEQGNNIACGDVVPFVKDELRLARGAIYDIRGGQEADKAEISRVAASLKAAGYRFIGGHEEY